VGSTRSTSEYDAFRDVSCIVTAAVDKLIIAPDASNSHNLTGAPTTVGCNDESYAVSILSVDRTTSNVVVGSTTVSVTPVTVMSRGTFQSAPEITPDCGDIVMFPTPLPTASSENDTSANGLLVS
jgi:hypothetical protein